jgi:ankyrin repeat protein
VALSGASLETIKKYLNKDNINDLVFSGAPNGTNGTAYTPLSLLLAKAYAITGNALVAQGDAQDALTYLLGQKADVNDQKGFRKMSPLMIAYERGVYLAADTLKQYSPNFNLKNIDGKTALMLAINNIMHTSSDQKPLAWGVQYVPSMILNSLDKTVNLEIIDNEGKTLLMMAITQNAPSNFISSLIKAGAQVGTVNEQDGNTSLGYGIQKGYNTFLGILTLAQKQSDFKKIATLPNKDGDTPLLLACKAPLVKDKNGNTPFLQASDSDLTQNVQALLKTGFVDYSEVNKQTGYTGLMYALESENTDLVKLILSEMIKKKDSGYINLASKKGDNAFTIAASKNNKTGTELLQLLFEHFSKQSSGLLLSQTKGEIKGLSQALLTVIKNASCGTTSSSTNSSSCSYPVITQLLNYGAELTASHIAAIQKSSSSLQNYFFGANGYFATTFSQFIKKLGQKKSKQPLMIINQFKTMKTKEGSWIQVHVNGQPWNAQNNLFALGLYYAAWANLTDVVEALVNAGVDTGSNYYADAGEIALAIGNAQMVKMLYPKTNTTLYQQGQNLVQGIEGTRKEKLSYYKITGLSKSSSNQYEVINSYFGITE